jgi:hypothetical protein
MLLTAKVGQGPRARARCSLLVRLPIRFWICFRSRSVTGRSLSRLPWVSRRGKRMLKILLALVASWISGYSLGRWDRLRRGLRVSCGSFSALCLHARRALASLAAVGSTPLMGGASVGWSLRVRRGFQVADLARLSFRRRVSPLYLVQHALKGWCSAGQVSHVTQVMALGGCFGVSAAASTLPHVCGVQHVPDRWCSACQVPQVTQVVALWGRLQVSFLSILSLINLLAACLPALEELEPPPNPQGWADRACLHSSGSGVS